MDNSLRSSTSQNQKGGGEFKIREYEWFELETKIRKFVQELMQPHIKRSTNDRKDFDKMTQDLEFFKTKVQDLQQIVLNNKEGIPFFKVMTGLIEKQDSVIKQMDNNMLTKLQLQHERIEEIQSRLNSQNEVIG